MAKIKVVSVCCAPLKRVIDSFSRTMSEVRTRQPGKRREREEIVYMHGVQNRGGQRWWRGARIS